MALIWAPSPTKTLAGSFAEIWEIPGRVSLVADPAGTAQTAIKLPIPDTDLQLVNMVNGAKYTAADPRADLGTPPILAEGDGLTSPRFVAWRVLIPRAAIAQILAAPTSGWMQVGEIYGLPQQGSPPIGLDVTVTAGQVHLALFRDATHDWDMPWQGPPLDGHWHTVAMQVGMSTDPTAGFVSIYYDGVMQLPALRYATMVPGVNAAAPNRVYANNYRKRGWLPGTVIVYHDARYPRVATTLAEATSWPQP